jgi:hypothetical protein
MFALLPPLILYISTSSSSPISAASICALAQALASATCASGTLTNSQPAETFKSINYDVNMLNTTSLITVK